jgi:Zn-finger nucleic acid-binding protein
MQDQVKAGMLCPVCKVELMMSDRQGVEVDYCRQCRGVWLDRGELDKIIERSASYAQPQAPAPAPEYREPERRYGGDYRDERYHGGPPHHGGYYRKRKSWLSDILDFD